MHELLINVARMRLKIDFLAEMFVLRYMGNELVPSPLMPEHRSDIRVFEHSIDTNRKRSKDRGSKHSKLISELSDTGMVWTGIARIYPIHRQMNVWLGLWFYRPSHQLCPCQEGRFT